MSYSLLADGVGIAHALFVLFVVGGQLLVLAGWAAGWLWTRNRVFRRLHLGAILAVVGISAFGYMCPLTVIESELRRNGGEAIMADGFIAHWLARLLYYNAPGWVFSVLYFGFATLVIVTYRRYPPFK